MIRDLVPVLPRSLMRLNERGLGDIKDAVDRMFESVVGDFDDSMPLSRDTGGINFMPRLEVDDRADDRIVSAELPGLTDWSVLKFFNGEKHHE